MSILQPFFSAAGSATTVLALAAWVRSRRRRSLELDAAVDGLLALANGLFAVAGILGRQWLWAAFSAAAAALMAWLWWRKRRRKGRAKAWLGAKSRALRDALVAKQREVTRPRPVLRPVPGSAGCS
jgi:hypothetical protein